MSRPLNSAELPTGISPSRWSGSGARTVAVVVASGTTALGLALLAVGMGELEVKRTSAVAARSFELLEARHDLATAKSFEWATTLAAAAYPRSFERERADAVRRRRAADGEVEMALAYLGSGGDSVAAEARAFRDLLTRQQGDAPPAARSIGVLSDHALAIREQAIDPAAAHRVGTFNALEAAARSAALPLSRAALYLAAVRRATGRPPVAEEVDRWLQQRLVGLRALARDVDSNDGDPVRFDVITEALPLEALDRHVPELAQRLEELLRTDDARLLQSAIRWMVGEASAAGSGVPPPVSPEVLFERTLALSRQVSSTVSEDLLVAALESHERSSLAGIKASAAFSVAAVVSVAGWLGSFILMRRQRRFEATLVSLARTDPLTRLSNRHALANEVTRLVTDPQSGGIAFIHLDLDRLKAINDLYGHAEGDRALKGVADRCREAVVGRRAVAIRLGGDEFLIVLTGLPDPGREAALVARDIQARLEEPLIGNGSAAQVNVCIGISARQAPMPMEDLLLESDIALHEAKNRGPGSIVAFDDARLREITRALPLVEGGRHIACELQPQIDLATGEVVGVEVLARWRAGDGTVVPARLWVAMVERLGETRQLLASVVVAAAGALRDLGGRDVGRLWINLSAADLAGFGAADEILQILDRAELDPARVGLEITETAALLDVPGTSRTIAALREAGLAVAIDDFGAGNTPLGHLTALEIDVVKIDRTVTAEIDSNPANQAVLAAMVDLCDALSLELLAEGIETERELETVRSLGVGRAQGYLLAAPQPAETLAASLPGPTGSRIVAFPGIRRGGS